MSNTVNNYTETDLGNISLNPRGEYDDSAAYEYLDAVSYQGGSYFCLAELETTITGIAPDAGRNSEHWQMIAAPGDMTPEYTAAHNDVIKKAVQVETSRAAVELAQQEIEAVQTDVQQLHSDTVQAAQEAENSKNSAANFAQSAEQSRKTVSESEQNINGQIAGFDSRVSEAVEQSKEEINTTKQQAINTITNQQDASVNIVKTEGEKIITRVGNDAKTVADDRATVEEATQTVLNNAQEVTRNAQTVASDTENAAASAESAKTSADNAAQSAKSVEDASKQIEQNKKDVDSLKIPLDNILSPNLYNPTDAKENTAINQDDGTEMSFDNWFATGYIPVSKGEVLYFSSNGEPTPYSTGAFYDKDKQRVDSFGNPNDNDNIAVTSDGYARFSFGSKKEKLQIEKGSRTTYIPYGELKVKADVDNIKKDTGNIKAEVSGVKAEVVKIQEDHTNLFNKNTVTKGAVLSESGYLETSFSSWDSSDYIPVKPGMVLYFSSNELPIGVASTGAYFDKDKKYLSPLKDEPLSITIPDGAYFIRFSKNGGFGNTLNTLKIEQHGITKFTPYGELYITVNESALPSSILPKWKGLKILTLGDSITAMGGVNGWTYWIKQYLLADKVVNVSVAGSTWQDKVANQTYDGNPQPSTDGNVMGNQVQKVLNAKANGDADYQDFDVITFSFGTNDSIDFSVQTKESVESQFITNYAQNNFTVVPLESVNRQTLAGAIRYGFQKLHEAYPNAVIFMCTPTQECYETFDSIYQKGDFINFVADRLGAETIDTRRCGIRNIYESQTTIDYDHPEQSGVAPIQTDLLDGIHTNENGAKKIAKYNAREIMKYFMIN